MTRIPIENPGDALSCLEDTIRKCPESKCPIRVFTDLYGRIVVACYDGCHQQTFSHGETIQQSLVIWDTWIKRWEEE